MTPRKTTAWLTAVLILLAPLAAPPAAAQALTDHEGAWATHGLGEVAFLGLNSLIGGVTAGLWQELSDGSFEDGFAGGALGGGVTYAGKRLAAESFPGAGFLGRDVAAVGASIVRNASDARPLLDSLVVPVGPLRLYVSPREPALPRVEVDVADVYWTAYGLAEDRLTLDAGKSLSSGMPVFRTDRRLLGPDDQPILGAAASGVVFLSPLAEGQVDSSLAHERAHVLQLDFVYHAWFRPLEDHLARELPADGLVDRVDYDVLAPALQWTGTLFGWGDPLGSPIEAEAEFLEGA